MHSNIDFKIFWDTFKVRMVGGQKQGGHWVSPVFLVDWRQTSVCFMVPLLLGWVLSWLKAAQFLVVLATKPPSNGETGRTKCCKAGHGLGYVLVEYMQTICRPLWIFFTYCVCSIASPIFKFWWILLVTHITKSFHKSTTLVLPSKLGVGNENKSAEKAKTQKTKLFLFNFAFWTHVIISVIWNPRALFLL